MTDEELAQFYRTEFDAVNKWLDTWEHELMKPDKFEHNTLTWHTQTGSYTVTNKQLQYLLLLRQSPLYKALK